MPQRDFQKTKEKKIHSKRKWLAEEVEDVKNERLEKYLTIPELLKENSESNGSVAMILYNFDLNVQSITFVSI